MLNRKVLDLAKVWFRFSRTTRDGKILKFCWGQLPEQRFEEFIDFKMNYYVKHEIIHVVAGIYKSPEAVEEYRKILAQQYRSPSHRNSICCVDDENNNVMVAIDSLKMFYRRSDNNEDILQAKTAEVKKLFHIFRQLDNLCPVPDVLAKYNANVMLDDAGLAIHPNYRGYRMTKEVALLRQTVCKANAVTLTGAWMTSIAPQKTTEKCGWETVYEICSEELEKILGIKLQNAPQMFRYKVKKIKERDA